MTEFHRASAVAASAVIRKRDVSAQELTSSVLETIAARNGEIGALTG